MSMTDAQQEAMESKKDRILEDVDELTPSVPTLAFKGTLPEVITALKEFEDGFVFVPVQKPRVEGDFYLANTYNAEDPKVLPEYSQTSGYYRFLPSHEALEEINAMLGTPERFEALVIIQKQISVTVRDLKLPDNSAPVMYYINSYNRSTRESIVLGFAMMAFRYMHRRSGASKEDLHVMTKFMEDESNYQKATKLMQDYSVTQKTFKAIVENTKMPIQKLAANMFNLDREHINKYVERGEEIALLWQLFRSRYTRDGNTPNLTNLISFFHDVYHFHSATEHYDVATKFISKVSAYLTKKILPYVKVMDVI